MPRRYGAAATTRLLGAATTSLRSSMLGRSSAIKATSPATSQRSATTTLRGTRSGPSFCLFAYLWSTFFPCVGLKELTQISASRFPPGTQSSQRVHTKKPGPAGGWDRASAAKGVGIQGKMPHRPLSPPTRQAFQSSQTYARFGEMQHDGGHAAFRVSRPISRMTNRR